MIVLGVENSIRIIHIRFQETLMNDPLLHFFREVTLSHKLSNDLFELEIQTLNFANTIETAQDELIYEPIDKHIFDLQENMFHEFPDNFFDVTFQSKSVSNLVNFQHHKMKQSMTEYI